MKIVISGYGKMGKMVERAIAEKGLELAGATEDVVAFDPEIAQEAVCIDFTTPVAFRENFPAIARKFKAVVVGTTGWYDIKENVFNAFREQHTTLIWASNFSVGVNVTSAAVELISHLLASAGGYSPYIIEKHHIHKLDAPSGTAKTLADDVARYMNVDPQITSVRVGEIPGIHTIGFEGMNDRITVEHEAFGRQGFAAGAVLAATMTEKVTTGIYEFKKLFIDVLSNISVK